MITNAPKPATTTVQRVLDAMYETFQVTPGTERTNRVRSAAARWAAARAMKAAIGMSAEEFGREIDWSMRPCMAVMADPEMIGVLRARDVVACIAEAFGTTPELMASSKEKRELSAAWVALVILQRFFRLSLHDARVILGRGMDARIRTDAKQDHWDRMARCIAVEPPANERTPE